MVCFSLANEEAAIIAHGLHAYPCFFQIDGSLCRLPVTFWIANGTCKASSCLFDPCQTIVPRQSVELRASFYVNMASWPLSERLRPIQPMRTPLLSRYLRSKTTWHSIWILFICGMVVTHTGCTWLSSLFESKWQSSLSRCVQFFRRIFASSWLISCRSNSFARC